MCKPSLKVSDSGISGKNVCVLNGSWWYDRKDFWKIENMCLIAFKCTNMPSCREGKMILEGNIGCSANPVASWAWPVIKWRNGKQACWEIPVFIEVKVRQYAIKVYMCKKTNKSDIRVWQITFKVSLALKKCDENKLLLLWWKSWTFCWEDQCTNSSKTH